MGDFAEDLIDGSLYYDDESYDNKKGNYDYSDDPTTCGEEWEDD